MTTFVERRKKPVDDLAEVLAEVANERQFQDAKWGEQNHPWVHKCERCEPGDDAISFWWKPGVKMTEEVAKHKVESYAEAGSLTYSDILMEEVVEALAADTPEHQIEELIQVAAVAVAAVQSIRRNGR